MKVLTTLRRAVALLLGLLLAALLLGAFPAASALAPSATGWWSTEQDALGALPGGAVPDRGLVVSATPTGPQAVAALHFDVPAGQRAVVLTLPVARASGAAPAIGACRVEPGWVPAHPGPYAESPQPACDPLPVPATVDGDSLLLNVAPLVRGSSLDLVLLPLPRVGGVYDAFRVTFAAPGEDALALDPQPAAGAPAPPPLPPAPPLVEAPSAAPAGAKPAPQAAAVPAGSPASEGSALPPPLPAPAAVGEVAPAPAAAPVGQAPAVAAPTAAGPTRLERADVDVDVGRAAALATLALLTAVLLLLSVLERRAVTGVAGVGRFARPRTGAPRPL